MSTQNSGAEWQEPGLRVLRAPNPGPMTHSGTNTYILGEGRVAVIDPGPALAPHLAAILAALAPGEKVSHILVTHSHADHSPLARPLAEATGAPVLAFGDAAAGRSPRMADLALEGALGGGEGVDAAFRPDVAIGDGAVIDGDGWTLRAIHTPGHIGNHLCLAWGDRVFSGDHVMGWATSLVSPPDGDMGAYMQSLDRLAAEGAARLFPGHGDPVDDPAARIAALAAHRREREAQILAALAGGAADVPALAARIYTDTPAALLPAATRNVLAHLVDLMDRNLVECDGTPGTASRFHAR
ncbi:MBL fold metallo-hydrolase [Albidovulum sediminis]|uniref:MBL fold metallo-hydrolase n=1 Tax=Albidovulum sediminis TaxID=3066345 RepID=A0ABT2NLW7_9RHOB|nr:MBL fold metallo-hydrolase [Defluviimonas sediminis]MCT8329098.1 MBL fold metallo-hydrolase [Defluviimonas sediminis]